MYVPVAASESTELKSSLLPTALFRAIAGLAVSVPTVLSVRTWLAAAPAPIVYAEADGSKRMKPIVTPAPRLIAVLDDVAKVAVSPAPGTGVGFVAQLA